jgi:hypothetical protein
MDFRLHAGGSGYSLVGSTGIMAAALAANSIVFAMRATPTPANSPARAPLQIDAINLAFTTITAFTTPVTAGRALALYKGTVALPTGGANISPISKWTKNAGADVGIEADVGRISTTATLTVGAFARGAQQHGLLDLAGFGAAGARVERFYPLTEQQGSIILEPGELLVVSNPAAMDAAGTWQLAIEIDYRRRD